MKTPPAEYAGSFSEQIRFTRTDGSEGFLREAYTREGVLYGVGWDEAGKREQRYAISLSEVEKIEVKQVDATGGLAGAAAGIVIARLATGEWLWEWGR